QSAQGFPLVVRGGLNPAGERVRYCLNFSGEPQAVTGVTGRDLLTGHDVGGNWDLPPWGVAIVVSQP
ncbi:MAG: Beta-galactosidase C-terminal domain, partial [Yersiniaceae bacterium]|nr:Beta-galactosidase C-terminal domain [Yersiniaceae bacterium]